VFVEVIIYNFKNCILYKYKWMCCTVGNYPDKLRSNSTSCLVCVSSWYSHDDIFTNV